MDPIAVLVDTLVTGLPFVPAFAGIWLVMRMRDDFDLTIDGSFTLGGAVTATLLVAGAPIVVAMLAGMVGGLIAGLITATLHLSLGIPVILAGLVMSLALFSLNLHVMGTPSISLASVDTMFSPLAGLDGMGPAGYGRDLASIGVIAVICLLVLGGLAGFLRTEVGLGLRATGRNPLMARSNGVHERRMLVLNLAAANALTGLSGALVVQNQGFADVNMGTGTLIAGAGALLLGELLLRPSGSTIGRAIVAIAVGTVAYRLVLVVALRAGLPASDLKLVTALTLILAFAAQLAGRRLGQVSLWRRRTRGALPAVSPPATARS